MKFHKVMEMPVLTYLRDDDYKTLTRMKRNFKGVWVDPSKRSSIVNEAVSVDQDTFSRNDTIVNSRASTEWAIRD